MKSQNSARVHDFMLFLLGIEDKIWATNEDRGWHNPPPPRSVAERNITSEFFELWESYRKGVLHEQCDKPITLPDGAPLSCACEEFADLVIRVVHLGAADAKCARGQFQFGKETEFEAALTQLESGMVSLGGALTRMTPTHQAAKLLDLADALGIEKPEEAILAKMAYNATRPIRHGGKVR